MSGNDNQALLLQVSADLNLLKKRLLKEAPSTVDQASALMEGRAKRLAKNLEDTIGKTNVSGALQKVFESSRLKVLDQGAARVSVFGGALEELGPVGLTAAAGIAAVGAALAGAREAAKFADDIGDTAAKLHVTTDALQEYRYAIRAAGGEEAGADEALEAFSVTLGKAQAGLPKALKAFKELGFTKDQVDGFKDAGVALDAVTKRISGLSNVQKDAVIDQLGLTGLKPLIESGADEMQRLRDEAHKVGIVMDSELVRRGGDLNDQFETVEKVINVQLKSALVDLGPILVSLLGMVKNMAEFAADIADAFKSIPDKSNRAIDNRIQEIDALLKAKGPSAMITDNGKPVRIVGRQGKSDQDLLSEKTQLLQTKISRQIAGPYASGASPKSLKDVSSAGSTGPRDDSAERLAQGTASIANADRQLYQALLGLTDDIEARRVLQHKILASEAAEEAARIARERASIAADKGISDAQKKALNAQLDKTADLNKQTNDAKGAVIDKQAADDLLRQQQEVDSATVEAGNAYLEIKKGLVKTGKARRDIENQILLNTQAQERRALEADIELNPQRHPNAEQDRANLSDKQTAERQQLVIDQNPLLAYARGIADLNTAMQDAAVNGLQSLNSGIDDIIFNGAKAKDVLGNVMKKFLADLLNAQLQKAEGGAIDALGHIFGKRAAGGPVSPGRLYQINEHGVEGFVPSVPGKIVPAAMMRAPSIPQIGRGGLQLQLHSTYQIEGAVGRSEIAAGIRQAHESAVQSAVSKVRRALPGWQQQIGTRGI